MKTDSVFLNRLDKAFWLVWAILPVVVGVRIYSLVTSGSFFTGGSDCGEKPIVDLSLAGQMLNYAFIAVGLGFYVLLFWTTHDLIRQFRDGGLFMNRSLQCLKRIAVVMLAWPFVKNVLLHALYYGLFLTGDIVAWQFQWYGLELTLIAAGLVVLALHLAMTHAIRLHQDAQYTV